MVDFLVFLLILCILFGVEATRSFIFGAFGFIAWIAIGIAALCIIAKLVGADKTEAERKTEAKHAAERKAAEQAEKAQKKYDFWNKEFPIISACCAILAIVFLVILVVLK